MSHDLKNRKKIRIFVFKLKCVHFETNLRAEENSIFILESVDFKDLL